MNQTKKKILKDLEDNCSLFQSSVIPIYKTRITQKTAKNWEKFFLDFREKTVKTLNEIKIQNSSLASQNQMLYKQNQEMRQQLRYMEERERMREQVEIEQKLNQERRKKAKKLPVRDAITMEEFEKILAMANQFYKDPFVLARIKVSLTILYTTGLRISNLLLLTKRNVHLLTVEGECQTTIIKGGAKRKILYIGTKGKDLFQKMTPELTILERHQPNDGLPLFTSKFDSSKPISKRTLIGQTNHILEYASSLFGKHIRSHSFRASFITDLLDEGIPIEKTKDIIGHSHIGTTATYRRTLVTVKELRKTITALNKGRWAKEIL